MLLAAFRGIIISLVILALASRSLSYELKTRYTTIVYETEDQLRRFNREIRLGRLSYLMRDKVSITMGDEVRNKIDVIVERVQSILEMFPREMTFKLILLSSDSEVRATFKNRYGKNVDYVAFYSPKEKTVFVSIKDVEMGVLAHEIAHVVIDQYYGVPTPAKLHEILAQYVEMHLKD
ncbi:MAG: hypothetical protein AB1390_07715 [Nitrospirota bacterium]